jgi:mRNA interferase RelE/StbE
LIWPFTRRHCGANCADPATAYKIKLHAAGFRLIDEVRDRQLLVLVLAVGKRDRNAAYPHPEQR